MKNSTENMKKQTFWSKITDKMSKFFEKIKKKIKS